VRFTGCPQRAVADQAGAEQRRRVKIGISGGQREAEAFVRDGVLGVSPIDVVPGEARAVAQVLAT